MKTFIIGLENSYRGQLLESSLEQAGMNFERSAGVSGEFMGKSLSEFVDQQTARKVHGSNLTEGEIGCALAHLLVYEKFLASTEEWALVFEDDASLIDPIGFQDFLEVIKRKHKDLPTIYLLWGAGLVGTGKRERLTESHLAWNLLIPPRSAVAYIINRKAARLIQKNSLPLISPGDWPLRCEAAIDFCAILPWLAIESGDTDSHIGKRNEGDNARFGGIPIWGFRVRDYSRIVWAVPRGYFGIFWSSVVQKALVRRLMGRRWDYLPDRSVLTIPRASGLVQLVYLLLGGKLTRRKLRPRAFSRIMRAKAMKTEESN